MSQYSSLSFFSESVINGIKEIQYLLIKKKKSLDSALKFLKEHRNYYDYDRAEYLIKKIDDLKSISSKEQILKKLVLFIKPNPFFINVQYGFYQAIEPINDNFLQCFLNAKILEKVNGEYESCNEKWWEDIKFESKKQSNEYKDEIGNLGHECTYEYECLELKKLGINQKPERTYLKSDKEGYDILSWRRNNSKEKYKIYIESKAFKGYGKELRINISANQEKTADEKGAGYFFYLWPNVKPWDNKNMQKPIIKNIKEIRKCEILTPDKIYRLML